MLLGAEVVKVISQIRTILAFTSRSTYAMEHFNHQRARLGIRQGLEHIGKTHFGTIYWSALSVQRGLPAFMALVENNIDIAVSQILKSPNRASHDGIAGS